MAEKTRTSHTQYTSIIAHAKRRLGLKFSLGLIFILTGCVGVFPLVSNQPPQIKTGNGVATNTILTATVSPMLTKTPTIHNPQLLQGGVTILNTEPSLTDPIQEALEASSLADESLPSSIFLDQIPVGKQTRSLNCEFQTISDLLWSYGYPYEWDEVFELVGHDPNGNPHEGFVGRSFDDPPGRLYPNGYGVYAEPIARGLKTVDISTEVHYNESEEWLKEQLSSGSPLMVWATANMQVRPPEYWTTKDGQRIKAVRGEHTYLVIGYDDNGVWVGDPWIGGRHHYPWSAFLASWSILDRMSLLIIKNEHQAP